MKKIVYIADFFVHQISGGAELVDDYIIGQLKELYDIKSINSQSVTTEIIEDNKNSFFIVSNFIGLSEAVKLKLSNCRYAIIEHDHKFLKTRDPSPFENGIAPADQIINGYFYRNAKAVFCQSKSHAECTRDNLMLNNVSNFGFSFWSDKSLDLIESTASNKKSVPNAILKSSNAIKGTSRAINYCKKHNIDYSLIQSPQYSEFISQLSVVENLTFFPQVKESFCRLVVEARMLGCSLTTNKNLGCASEEWFSSLKGKELIDFARQKIRENIKHIKNVIEGNKSEILIEPKEYPKISIITSMYKGEKYIDGFLKNIVNQTVFKSCELIIMDADSPENEFPIIEKYMKKYSNIYYEKLDKDPGIYGTWNLGIRRATGKYITNANLDDNKSLDQIEIMVNCLEKNQDIDLAYSEAFITHVPNETYGNNSSQGKTYPVAEFSREAMIKCLPGCMPVWRKSMHDKAGMFDESYRSAGDWEMWLRAVRAGSKFKKVNRVCGIYYMNPNGLSTNVETQKEKFKEEQKVFWEYTDVFGKDTTSQYEGYFTK